MRIFGDYADSPAYNLADDEIDRDAGCWDIIPVGAATTWSTMTVEKPDKGIERVIEIVGARQTIKKSGVTESDYDALREVITVKYQGNRNSEADKLLEMIACKNNQIRFYANPTTYPNDYQTETLIYENIKMFAKCWVADPEFKEDLIVKFTRAYED